MRKTNISIRTAFSRITSRVLIGAGLGGAAAVLITFLLVEHRAGKRSALERARLCACALTPGPAGDLSAPFERLRDRYPELIAVAPLSPQGRVQQVLAADPRLVPSVAAIPTGDSAPMRGRLLIAGRPEPVWAVTLPLNGTSDDGAWNATFVLHDRTAGVGAIVTALALLLIVLPIGIGKLILDRWCRREIVGALSRFAAPSIGLRREESRTPEKWAETEAVAERIVQETRRAQVCDATVRQNTYTMKKQLAEEQAKLDHQLRRAEDRATVDPLTRLRNRRFLEQELEPLLRRQRARSGDLAAAMIDLDNFKTLNDTQGHKVGDMLLRSVGELLRAAIRPDDIAIRVGGDEFLLLLPDIGADKAAKVAERIRALFCQLAGKSRAFEGVTMSIGVAAARDNPLGDGHALIDCADKALYRAKHGGKSRVCTSLGRHSRPCEVKPLSQSKPPGRVAAHP